MSDFGCQKLVARGTGYKPSHCTNGSIQNAKEYIKEKLKEEKFCYLSDSIIRKTYPDYKFTNNYIWEYGSIAHIIPVENVIEILDNFDCGFFDSFELRDTTDWQKEHPNYFGSDEKYKYIMVFKGLNNCTDHCYD